MMKFRSETARSERTTAKAFAAALFNREISDAQFLGASRERVLAVAGLPFYAPVAGHLLNDLGIRSLVKSSCGSVLLARREDGIEVTFSGKASTEPSGNPLGVSGESEPDHRAGEACMTEPLDPALSARAEEIIARVLRSPGRLDETGDLLLDLKSDPVGLHYPVNLLLGDRSDYPHPLVTTPKSAVDAFGRGSFRAAGQDQVLATRYVLAPEENGEPSNRQFYLTEDGRQIFYSLDVRHNVKSAVCRHSRNFTEITYETEDGLRIERRIFLLPQEKGLPSATEVQRVAITNSSEQDRTIRFVGTGVFGIAEAATIATDVVYANLVQETEVYYEGRPGCGECEEGGRGDGFPGRESCKEGDRRDEFSMDDGPENARWTPVALSLNAKPADDRGKKRFVMLLAGGGTMDEFCTDQAAFLGSGTLTEPEMLAQLPNEYSRKMASFFAVAKELTIPAGGTVFVDELVGLDDLTAKEPGDPDFADAIRNLYLKFRDPAALEAVFSAMQEKWNRYRSWLLPETGDERFNAYVAGNLPFQVLYQTYVSRAFAWTQKSYRETGFREIQDLYASMPYFTAAGREDEMKILLGSWIRNVFRMGYANHNFTWKGKEPGMCSDDALWLVDAVYRYVMLTGDAAFLLERFEVADGDGERPLLETLDAILTYSGRISVGKHGLPLLDVADWNDTLRLDREVLRGPEKEALYAKQLAETGAPYGTPLENDLSESVMNGCLLKIAADETAALCDLVAASLSGKTSSDRSESLRNGEGCPAGGISRAAGSAREGADRPVCEASGLDRSRALAIGRSARKIAADTLANTRKHAWKGDYYARCLLNDARPYEYLGATGDGLAADPEAEGSYFLNSFSWAILAGIATEEEIRLMLDRVNRELRTDAGLKLCTLVDFDRLGVKTGTAFYFPGDRENCGVFKHAAMMAARASLHAAKTVQDTDLACALRELAFFMIDKTLPYRTLCDPFVLKGNPRFCTQYNNSETGENIGPMLSGTASWLTLCIYEYFGMEIQGPSISFDPILREDEPELSYALRMQHCVLHVRITGTAGRFRRSAGSTCTLNGEPADFTILLPESGEHRIEISL